MIGSVWAALIAVALVVGSGYLFNFSPLWKTDVSLVTSSVALILLIFLQKSQNHSDMATHLKLDELIKAVTGAREEIIAAETQPESEMDRLKEEHLREIEKFDRDQQPSDSPVRLTE
jgi:low affinity Fe/Cu permease